MKILFIADKSIVGGATVALINILYELKKHNTFEAVSYTHLDVYKRQGIVGTVFFLGFMVLACIIAIKLLFLCSDNDLTYSKRTRCCVIFSFSYQIFFIIYCITASPLHQAYTSNSYYLAAFLGIYIYINRNKYFMK